MEQLSGPISSGCCADTWDRNRFCAQMAGIILTGPRRPLLGLRLAAPFIRPDRGTSGHRLVWSTVSRTLWFMSGHHNRGFYSVNDCVIACLGRSQIMCLVSTRCWRG